MEVTTEGPIMGQAGGHIIMPKLQHTLALPPPLAPSAASDRCGMNPDPNTEGRGCVQRVLGAAPEAPSPAVHRSTGDPQALQGTIAYSRYMVVTTSMRPSQSMCCCCCTCCGLLRPPLHDALWMVAGPSRRSSICCLATWCITVVSWPRMSQRWHCSRCSLGSTMPAAEPGSCERRQRTLCATG